MRLSLEEQHYFSSTFEKSDYTKGKVKREKLPAMLDLVEAACRGDLPEVISCLECVRGLGTFQIRKMAFLGAIMRAALSEPGGEMEAAALDCADAVLESAAGVENQTAPLSKNDVVDLLGLDPFLSHSTRLPLIFRHEYPDPHYPRPQFDTSRFAVRFVEFKFAVALKHSHDIPSSMLYRTCLDALFPYESRNVVYYYLLLNSPLATDLFRRLLAKHELVRYTCERMFSAEFGLSGSTEASPRLPASHKAPAFVLGVNLGMLTLDLSSFGEMLDMNSLTWSPPPRHLMDDMVRISATLVDDPAHPTATKPRFDFNRPGIISCIDWRIDRLVTNVLRMEKKDSDAIMANLLRCRRFAEHDPRYAAFSIVNRRSSTPSCAEVEFCTEWMRSELHRASWLGKASHRSVLWLFRKSTPKTAPQAWTLLLMLKDVCGMDARSLGGLCGIYHPFMSDAAMRCLVWNHPLAATHMIHIRERHYRVIARSLSENRLSSQPMFVADSRLADAAAVAQVVRCVGGPEMSLLFGGLLPLLARLTVKSFLM
jgi:hypothetical protein